MRKTTMETRQLLSDTKNLKTKAENMKTHYIYQQNSTTKNC